MGDTIDPMELRTLVAALRNLSTRFKAEGYNPAETVDCPGYGVLLSPEGMDALAEMYAGDLLEMEEGPPVEYPVEETTDGHPVPVGS